MHQDAILWEALVVNLGSVCKSCHINFSTVKFNYCLINISQPAIDNNLLKGFELPIGAHAMVN